MKLIIAGDLVPGETNEELFSKGNVEELLGEDLKKVWNAAEWRIFNLEAPLTDSITPIEKCGPNLRASMATITGIKKLNPSLITLANNHILDQGVQGLSSTELLLKKYNIHFIGAGENIRHASAPYILEKGGYTIGVYTCAENEFTIATEKTPGANPFDPLESLDHIADLKSKCDYVIVLYHGGKEHYRYPSPYLQKVLRKIVEKGADVVVAQHSHCIGCYEKYLDSTIIYGQGNFIFDRLDNEYWSTSILIDINIGDKLDINYIPIVKNGNVIRLAQKEKAEDIIGKFNARSFDIRQENFVEENYKKHAKEKLEGYLKSLAGFGKWTSRFDRKLLKGAILKKLYTKDKYLAIQNYIECEAHRELLIKGLEGARKGGR